MLQTGVRGHSPLTFFDAEQQGDNRTDSSLQFSDFRVS
jgi:hypothetical protein